MKPGTDALKFNIIGCKRDSSHVHTNKAQNITFKRDASQKQNARSRHGEQSHHAHEQLANAQCVDRLEFNQHEHELHILR